MSGSSAGLGSTHGSGSCCSTCPEPRLRRVGSEGGPGVEQLQFEQSSQVGSFSLVEKPLEMAAMEKAELLPNTEMFPDLFTNIWCSFLDAVQTEIQPHASATSCPAPHPRLLHPGEKQGWEELVRGEEGIGLLFPSGRSCRRDAGARLCSEGRGDRPEAPVACHGPRTGRGRRARTGSACPAPRATQARARPLPNGK